MEANDDLYHECQKELDRKDHLIAKLKKENLEVVRQKDESLDKYRDMRRSEIELSDGMINGLTREFSGKKEIIKKLMQSPAMNADFTNASVNGHSAQVLILASPIADAALYIGREKKGHKGIEGTPLENYVGIVLHDHDKTFYRYGTKHQERPQHDCRYLVGSEQNEPQLEWNKEILHYRNGLREKELDPIIVEGFEKRYDEILNKAEKEYQDEPPTEYYKEGYNLFLRLRECKESELLFLHDKRVPANNSLCERLARVYKRKQKQAITLRSQESFNDICDGLSIVYLLCSRNVDVYQKISEIYERKRPPKIKQKRLLLKLNAKAATFSYYTDGVGSLVQFSRRAVVEHIRSARRTVNREKAKPLARNII